MSKRVVVTGLGVVTPLGLEVDELWDNLIAGRSGVGPITKFDASDQVVRIAAEVKAFDVKEYMSGKEARRTDPYCHYAIAAATKAVDESGLDSGGVDAERLGVILGTGQGGITSMVDQAEVFLKKGPRRVSPFCVPMMIANMASGHVAMKFGAKGPNLTLTTACAASGHAVGEAFRILQRGDADVIIAGGTESGIVPLSVAGFAAMRALSTRNDHPEEACRPFDADRDGFVMGEGAGVMVMETLEHAERRGAEILAEIYGYGLSADAHHITAPPESGEGGIRSMKEALNDAGMAPEDVDYINAHGTGTPTGDAAESRAIEEVFGQAAFDIPVSSTKSMTGHLLGAAGALESIISIQAIRHGVVPPTLNLENPDEGCRLDYVPGEMRRVSVDVALTNSFGFGGQNATLIWGRHDR